MEKSCKTFVAKIYLAGDINIIKQTCRKYCMTIGLCVTVTETLFIYTGGEEFGVEVGLINYPRFESTEDDIRFKTIKLAEILRQEAVQHSYLVLFPDTTIWNTIKE